MLAWSPRRGRIMRDRVVEREPYEQGRPRVQTSSIDRVCGRGAQPCAGGAYLLDRLLARAPALDRDELALEVLVNREELLDLLAQQQRQLIELLVVVPVGVMQRHADD